MGACLLFKEKWAFQKASRVKNWSQLMQSFILKRFFSLSSFKSQLFAPYTQPKKRPLISSDVSFLPTLPQFLKSPSKRCGMKLKMTGLYQIFTFQHTSSNSLNIANFQEKKI